MWDVTWTWVKGMLPAGANSPNSETLRGVAGSPGVGRESWKLPVRTASPLQRGLRSSVGETLKEPTNLPHKTRVSSGPPPPAESNTTS